MTLGLGLGLGLCLPLPLPLTLPQPYPLKVAGHEGWNLDMSSIFAQLNAFVQVRSRGDIGEI